MDWPKSLKEEFAFWQAMIAANSSGSIRMWQTGSSGDSSHGSAKALEIWRNPWRCTSATPKNQERENMLGVSSYLQCLRLDFHCRTRKPTAQALNQTGLSQNVKLRLAYRLAFVTNRNKKRIKGGFKCRVCCWSWTNQQIRAEVRTLPWPWHQRLRRNIFGRLPEAAATVLSDWCLYPSLIILGHFFFLPRRLHQPHLQGSAGHRLSGEFVRLGVPGMPGMQGATPCFTLWTIWSSDPS